MQIICGGKLSRFSWISPNRESFPAIFFLSYYGVSNCYTIAKVFPRIKDHATAKLFHREQFALYGSYLTAKYV